MAAGGDAGKVVVALPHEIRGVVADPTPLWVYVLATVLVIAVVAALYGVTRRMWKKYQLTRAPKTVPIDVWARLLGEIRALEPPTPLTQEAAEEYYFQLSLKLRQAIEWRTQIPATDRTTGELRELLRRRLPLATAEVDALLDFLGRADVVKFAATATDGAEALSWQDRVARWAADLRPREGAAS